MVDKARKVILRGEGREYLGRWVGELSRAMKCSVSLEGFGLHACIPCQTSPNGTFKICAFHSVDFTSKEKRL